MFFRHIVRNYTILVTIAFTTSTALADLQMQRDMLTITINSEDLSLDVLIGIPEGSETDRFPVALITHGASGPQHPRDLDTSLLSGWVRDLTARDYFSVAIMRQGYGRSDGEAYGDNGTCAEPAARPFADAHVADLAAALEAISQRTDTDMSTVIGLGHSAGGIAMLGLAAHPDVELDAVTNVSGGSFRYEKGAPLAPGNAFANCPNYLADLENVLKQFAAESDSPNLWLYAENDPFFGPDLATKWTKLWRGAGANVDLQILPEYESNGHRMFVQSPGQVELLKPVDHFLRKNGLPNWNDDAFKPLRSALSPRQNERLESFLSNELAMKAMAVPAVKSTWSAWAPDMYSLEAARLEAKARCEKDSGEECIIIVENFRPTGNLPK